MKKRMIVLVSQSKFTFNEGETAPDRDKQAWKILLKKIAVKDKPLQ
jgi:hypothetical protein